MEYDHQQNNVTGKGTKRKIVPVNVSTSVGKARLSCSGNVERYLEYKLFTTDDKNISDEVRLDTNMALTKFFDAFARTIEDYEVYSPLFDEIIDILERIKAKMVNFLSKSTFCLRHLNGAVTEIKDENAKLATKRLKDNTKELARVLASHDPSTVMLDQRTRNRISKLNKALSLLAEQIDRAEASDIEDLEVPGLYTRLPRLYKRVLRFWEEREQLLKRAPLSGRSIYTAKFKYEGSGQLAIDSAVSEFFNRYLAESNRYERIKSGQLPKAKLPKELPSLSVIELKKLIVEVSKEKNLVNFDLDQRVERIYRDLIKESKIRRCEDYFDYSDSLELDKNNRQFSANHDDPEIDKLLSEKTSLDEQISSVVNLYSDKDLQLNGPIEAGKKPLGFDDVEEEEQDDEEEENESEDDED